MFPFQHPRVAHWYLEWLTQGRIRYKWTTFGCWLLFVGVKGHLLVLPGAHANGAPLLGGVIPPPKQNKKNGPQDVQCTLDVGHVLGGTHIPALVMIDGKVPALL